MSKWFKANLALTSLILFFTIYFSTGNLSPYAIGEPYFHIHQNNCGYMYNLDHDSFKQVYWMINGDARETWQDGINLKRILYPLISYPLIKAFNSFEVGSVVTSIILHIIVFIIFIFFVKKRLGHQSAFFASWILCIYSGICYFGGTPYSYAAIFPSILLFIIFLTKISESTQTKQSFLYTFFIGILLLIYDFSPLFVPATLLLYIFQKKFKQLIPAFIILIAPYLLYILFLEFILKMNLLNPNSGMYLTIMNSWLSVLKMSKTQIVDWFNSSLIFIPRHLLFNSTWSCMLFLPLLFLGVLTCYLLKKGEAKQVFLIVVAVLIQIISGLLLKEPTLLSFFIPIIAFYLFYKNLSKVELALCCSIYFFMLFNISVPPYGGTFPMYGKFIARMYAPLSGVFIMSILRFLKEFEFNSRFKNGYQIIIKFGILLYFTGNFFVTFGPILNNPFNLSYEVYRRYYTLTPYKDYAKNNSKYARVPIGFCKE